MVCAYSSIFFISFCLRVKAPECSRRFNVYILARRQRCVSFICEIAIVKCCVVCELKLGIISVKFAIGLLWTIFGILF